MEDTIDIAHVAGLLADSSRSTMLQALMDQRARTAGELARLAKIAPSTASQHLGRLTDGRLLVVEAQGRHRYYRLADPMVATLLESLMTFAPAPAPAAPRAPNIGFDLRFARTCYDHLAGALGAALLDSFRARGWLIPRSTPRALRLTTTGRQAFASHFDIDVSVLTNVRAVTKQTRPS